MKKCTHGAISKKAGNRGISRAATGERKLNKKEDNVYRSLPAKSTKGEGRSKEKCAMLVLETQVRSCRITDMGMSANMSIKQVYKSKRLRNRRLWSKIEKWMSKALFLSSFSFRCSRHKKKTSDVIRQRGLDRVINKCGCPITRDCGSVSTFPSSGRRRKTASVHERYSVVLQNSYLSLRVSARLCKEGLLRSQFNQSGFFQQIGDERYLDKVSLVLACCPADPHRSSDIH